MKPYKKPVSVLVVIHTPDLNILLLERAPNPGYWQSVTGSQEGEEPLIETACREVLEETGIDARQHLLSDWGVTNTFEIFPQWRHRYAPGITSNTEHVFGLTVPRDTAVTLAPNEHRAYCWLPWRVAAERCFSWTNRDAILLLENRNARL